jgi:hypothetical protein
VRVPAEFWDIPGTSRNFPGVSAGNLALFRKAKLLIPLIPRASLASFRNFEERGASGAARSMRLNRQDAKDAKEVGEKVDAGAALPNWVRFAESMFWLRPASWRLGFLAVPLRVSATAPLASAPRQIGFALLNWLCHECRSLIPFDKLGLICRFHFFAPSSLCPFVRQADRI